MDFGFPILGRSVRFPGQAYISLVFPHVWACFRFGGAVAKLPETGNVTLVRHANLNFSRQGGGVRSRILNLFGQYTLPCENKFLVEK